MKTADSATVRINSLAQEKVAAGIQIFNLSVGEPNLPPHPLLVEAVNQALAEGKTLYPPVSGLPKLKNLACNWMNTRYDCDFQEENCLVVNGGKLGIYLLLQMLVQKNDEVLIPAPYWVSYPSIVKLFDGVPVILETNEECHWKLTAQQVQQACTPRTKILILNNACNPTGALYTREELHALLAVAKANNLIVISDEVYSELCYDHQAYISCGSFKEYQDQVILIQSFSKNFAMTGWRIGLVFGPVDVIKPLTSLISQTTSGVTTISQWAAIAALMHQQTISSWVRTEMERRRNILITAFNKAFKRSIQAPPSALYLFISLNELGITNQSANEFCQQALEQANIAMVPGSAFGKEGYLRLSFGAKEYDLQQGIIALAEWIKGRRVSFP